MQKSDTVKRVEAARARLMLKAPFYSVLAMRLPIVETTNVRGHAVDTYATDGTAIYVNPTFDATLTPKTRMGAIADEVEHCSRGDQFRRQSRDGREWNISADIRNARSILAAGLELPPGAIGAQIARERPDLARESAERIYAIRAREAAEEAAQKPQEAPPEPEEAEEPQGGQEGEDEPHEPQEGQDEAEEGEDEDSAGQGDEEGEAGEGEGSGDSEGDSDGEGEGQEGEGEGEGQEGEGEGGDVIPGEPGAGERAPQTFGEVLDYPGDDAERAEAEREWRMAVAQAAAIANAHEKNAGRGPGAYAEVVECSQAAAVDWREKLRRFASDCIIRDTDWNRRARRSHGEGFIWPGQKAIAPAHVALVEDTSGSMDVEALKATRAEAQGMLDSRAVERITLIQCDDNVSGVWEFQAGDIIEAPHLGRGGTSYAPAWRYIEENCQGVACVIYLTDLQPNGGVFDRFDAAPVLWAVPLAPPQYRAFIQVPQPPFGEVVEVDPWQ